MKKVECILLIDDNDDDNYFHTRVIDKSEGAETIVTKLTGQKALDFLLGLGESDVFPQLIFLDINMPGMNGWEFLEEYKSLGFVKKRNAVIYMLTTSDNPDDKLKALKFDYVSGFLTKPLRIETLEEVLKKHF